MYQGESYWKNSWSSKSLSRLKDCGKNSCGAKNHWESYWSSSNYWKVCCSWTTNPWTGRNSEINSCWKKSLSSKNCLNFAASFRWQSNLSINASWTTCWKSYWKRNSSINLSGKKNPTWSHKRSSCWSL